MLQSHGLGLELVDRGPANVVGETGILRAQSVHGRNADLVGQHRVVSTGNGQQALGGSQHEHGVEVVADRARQRPEEDPFTKAAVAAAGDIEFGSQGTLEHIERRTRLDGVEPGQTDECRLEPFEGDLLTLGPRRMPMPGAEQPGEQCLRGVALVGPG